MASRLNSPDLAGVLHFVTLNVRERKRAFARPEYADMVLQLLRFECNRHPACLVAYVVMPDHLHFLFGPRDGEVQRFLARFKPNATRNLDEMAQEQGRVREREWLAGKGKRELWQDGKYSLPVYSEKWITQKIHYIHQNPVRRNLVESSTDYQWSSALAYSDMACGAVPVAVDVNWQGFFEEK